MGVLPWGQTETENTQRFLSQDLSLADPRAQTSPGSPRPRIAPGKRSPPRSRPSPPKHLLSEGAHTRGSGRWPRTSSITPSRGAPSALGTILERDPRDPVPVPPRALLHRVRVPLAVSGRYPGNAGMGGEARGLCPDPAAPSLLFLAAAHKIFSLTTVRARARACLGNREGGKQGGPPAPEWVGRKSCLLPQFPQPEQENPSCPGRRTPGKQPATHGVPPEQNRRDNLGVTLPHRVNLRCQERMALGSPRNSSPTVKEKAAGSQHLPGCDQPSLRGSKSRRRG